MSDMFSTPPARTTSASPVWMRRAASTIDSIPEAQLRDDGVRRLLLRDAGAEGDDAPDVRGVGRRRDVPEDRLVDLARLDARAGHRLDGGGPAQVGGGDGLEVGPGLHEGGPGPVEDVRGSRQLVVLLRRGARRSFGSFSQARKPWRSVPTSFSASAAGFDSPERSHSERISSAAPKRILTARRGSRSLPQLSRGDPFLEDAVEEPEVLGELASARSARRAGRSGAARSGRPRRGRGPAARNERWRPTSRFSFSGAVPSARRIARASERTSSIVSSKTQPRRSSLFRK